MAKTTWEVDPTHSELGFKIRHLMISNVSGTFGKFDVSVDTEADDFTKAKIVAKIDPATINTKNAQRDEHLRASDFFEVEKYPEVSFESTSINAIDEENFVVVGDLTLRGITKSVSLNVEYSGIIAKDPWGLSRAGFMVTGKINRNDFGLTFNSVLDTGGLALGEEVKIQGDIQLVKQEAAVAV